MTWDKRADMIVHSEQPFNAEPPRAALADAPLTGHDAFYVRNHGPVPDVDPATWRLRVEGARSRDWSLAGLRATFDAHDVVATLQCAGNRRAGLIEVRDVPGQAPWGPCATSTARWTGVRLADVLDDAGLGAADGAGYVEFSGPDVSDAADPPQPFGGSIPLVKARSGEVLLAWAMNGEDLPAVHGGPVRVLVPGYVGARSVKWVDRITVRDTPSENWFQRVAYRMQPADGEPADGFPLGAVAINSDVLSPDDGARVPAGPTTVRGYALAGGDREIARVEVSTDGGAHWRRAELGEQHSPWTWRLWSATLDLPPGPAAVVVRAWDTSATVQPESAAQMWNPGGYANNAWARVDLTVG